MEKKTKYRSGALRGTTSARMREVAGGDVNRHEIERETGRTRRYHGCLSSGIERGEGQSTEENRSLGAPLRASDEWARIAVRLLVLSFTCGLY